MTTKQKKRIAEKILALLEEFIDIQESDDNIVSEESDTKASTTEMLTVKECTVRLLASSGKISSVRAGEGKNGKILVNKSSLLDYMNRKNVR